MLLYIDPGTGSMLFTILVGVLGAAVYLLRNVFIKIRFFFSGGKRERADADRIPIAIFSESKRYWNVFKPILDELEKRGEKAVYLTASQDDPALGCRYEHITARHIGEGNKVYARMNMLKADVVLSTTPGLGVYQWTRSREVSKYVHIPHAASDLTLYRMFGLDYYDAVMVSGEYQIEQIRSLERIRGLDEKELPMIGITYMDAMLERLEAARRQDEQGSGDSSGSDKHTRTVLLAPSWGASAIFSRYGGRILDELLKTDCRLIVRPHPQSFTSEAELMNELMRLYPESERLVWDRSNDNFEVLRSADILISDFSGVIFDYALVFDRPVIYADTQFDNSVYDAWWLEDEPWTFGALEKLGTRLTNDNIGRLDELIDECLSDERFKQGRDEVREQTWANIGHAAELAASYLIELRKGLLESAEAERIQRKKSKPFAKKAKAKANDGECVATEDQS